MSDILKWFLELYVDVFKNYTLAASLTTLIFVAVYWVWNEQNKKHQPTSIWGSPEFVMIVAWLIVTPMLGFLFSLFAIAKDVVSTVGGLYVQIFKSYPAAGAIITVIFGGIYFIWRTILKKWTPRATGVWAYPGVVLCILWLLATPLLGFVMKAPTPEKEQESKQVKSQTVSPKTEAGKAAAQEHK